MENLLFLILFFPQVYSSNFLLKPSEPCNDTNGNPLICPHNYIYYFECCANECCLRTQFLPAIVIAIVAIVMTVFCCIACIAYCCGGE